MSAPRTAGRSPQLRIAPPERASFERRVHEAFVTFVGDERFPCLAARGVLRRGDYEIGIYPTMASADASVALAADLARFTSRVSSLADRMTAYVAVFRGRTPAGERAFERRLWAQLQGLHDRDDPLAGWDPGASPDPEDPHFSFSFGGCALFVVGMHPRSSRLARRFRWPALVFNPHAQFERLRNEGHFERVRDAIRDRDVALQGNVNPNLADFGERSEARQYSGRDTTGDEWRCPFHLRGR